MRVNKSDLNELWMAVVEHKRKHHGYTRMRVNKSDLNELRIAVVEYKRKHHGYTRDKIREKLFPGVSLNAFHGWFKKPVRIGEDNLVRLERFFGVSGPDTRKMVELKISEAGEPRSFQEVVEDYGLMFTDTATEPPDAS